MLHSLANAGLVIDAYIADAADGWSNVNKNERHFSETKIGNQIIFHAEGKDRHAVHAALDHASHRTFHTFCIRSGGAEQNLVAVLNGKFFESLYDFREERVGDLRHD